MYPNEGAVDTTAVKMSQMVGVFLAGLGLAAVTMRPAEMDAADVQDLVNRLTTMVSNVDRRITDLSNSNTTVVNQVRSAVQAMEAIDLSPLDGLVSGLSSSASSMQTAVQQMLAALDTLDVSVDLSPITAALDRNLTAINGIDLEAPDFDLSVILQAIESVQTAQSAIVDSLSDIQQAVPGAEAMDDLSAAISSNLSAIQSHRQAFDEFIDAILA